MTSTTRLLKLAPLAIATTIAAGCDHADDLDVQTDDFDIEFRGGDYKTTPQKLNTGYLGEDDLPLNAMPMIEGATDGVEIDDIRTRVCQDSAGAFLFGKFSRKATGMDVDIPLNDVGKLLSMELANVNNPTQICTISGSLWKNTIWEIRVGDAAATDMIETDLWLTDLDLDMHGMPVYQFKVNYPRVNPAYAGEIKYHNTCDEDEDPLDPSHSHHAYLLPHRTVQDNGTYVDTQDTMYMACLSSAVGKAQNFGYSYTESTDVAELGSRMVRADYCGDGVPHTENGTQIWLQDILEVWGEETPEDEHAREAIWSANLGRAACLDTPRLQGQAPVECVLNVGGDPEPLPACDDQMTGEITTLVPIAL